MTPHLLDELLDRSAPSTRDSDPSAVRAMISAASREARPPGRRRVAVASGVLAVLLVGGAGVAVATDGFTWSSAVQESPKAVAE